MRDYSVSDESDDSVRNRSQQESARAGGDILLVSRERETGVSSDGVTHTSFDRSFSHPPGSVARLYSNTLK